MSVERPSLLPAVNLPPFELISFLPLSSLEPKLISYSSSSSSSLLLLLLLSGKHRVRLPSPHLQAEAPPRCVRSTFAHPPSSRPCPFLSLSLVTVNGSASILPSLPSQSSTATSPFSPRAFLFSLPSSARTVSNASFLDLTFLPPTLPFASRVSFFFLRAPNPQRLSSDPNPKQRLRPLLHAYSLLERRTGM